VHEVGVVGPFSSPLSPVWPQAEKMANKKKMRLACKSLVFIADSPCPFVPFFID
jgi:hypothetical protein